MIEYDDYEKINKYLDNNELDKIREYIEQEYKKTDLILAREALSKYLDTYRSVYEHIDGKLLVSDFKSIYILGDDKLLSDYRKKKLMDPKHKVNGDINRIYDIYNSLLLCDKLSVDTLKEVYLDNFEKNVYELKSLDGSVINYFHKSTFDPSKQILGKDVRYSLLNNNVAACFAESERGKALIMGIKIND